MTTLTTIDATNIPTDGGHVFVRDSGGHGPAILCLPGLGDTGASFRHLLPLLADAGNRVLVMDLRGHGRSATSFASYSPIDIARDALAVLDNLGIGRASVIGCSIGGGAAAWLAAEAPERVEKLVLVNPFVRDVAADQYFRPLSHLLFARPWGAWAWTQYFRTLLPTKPADLDAYVADLAANLKEPGRLHALGQMIRASKVEVEARLGDVSAPTLVVMGGADPDYPDPVAEGELVVNALGGATQLEVLDGLGHYPHAERPEATAALVTAFLAADRAAKVG